MLCHGLKPRELRHAAPGAHGYRKGGGSSSSSATTSTSIDKRMVVDGGVGVTSDQSTVNLQLLDAGAVTGALKFAEQTGADASKNVQSVLGVGLELFKNSFGLLDKAQANVNQAGQLVATAYDDAKGQGTEKTLLTAAVVGVVAVVGLRAFGKAH